MHDAPDAVTAEVRVDGVAVGMRHLGDRVRDVADAIADDGGRDRGIQRPLGRVDEREILVARGADDERDGGVGDPAVDRDGEVERHQIAVAHRVVERQAVQHRVVDEVQITLPNGLAPNDGW